MTSGRCSKPDIWNTVDIDHVVEADAVCVCVCVRACVCAVLYVYICLLQVPDHIHQEEKHHLWSAASSWGRCGVERAPAGGHQDLIVRDEDEGGVGVRLRGVGRGE